MMFFFFFIHKSMSLSFKFDDRAKKAKNREVPLSGNYQNMPLYTKTVQSSNSRLMAAVAPNFP